MANSYLDLAREAIQKAREPLSPSDMLQCAKEGGFLPDHLHGSTMHKTLTARLSEEVRKNGRRSEFFRTGPNVFFLYDLALMPDTPSRHKEVYQGFRRSKSIRKEDVLVANRNILQRHIFGEFVEFCEDEFYEFFIRHCRFLDRSFAEEDDSVKQFVTFTLVRNENHLLIYRRGKFTTTSETLKGQSSVGFGGHVNAMDFDLFHRGGEAFKANAARELREELYLDQIYSDFEETLNRTKILGYINVDGDSDAEHHIAVLMAFDHKISDLPKRGELAITRLSWLDLGGDVPDLGAFDFWSKIILKKIFSKELVI